MTTPKEKAHTPLDLETFKESLKIVRTGKDSKGVHYNEYGTLNQAAWMGERAGLLIAEIERLRNDYSNLLIVCQSALADLRMYSGHTETKRLLKRAIQQATQGEG